jgi:hypothetical protein
MAIPNESGHPIEFYAGRVSRAKANNSDKQEKSFDPAGWTVAVSAGTPHNRHLGSSFPSETRK